MAPGRFALKPKHLEQPSAVLATAIRWTKGNGSSGMGRVLLSCRVKPGVSAGREGITAVTDEHVEICVTNQARDGAANIGVVKIIGRALQLPKSDVTLVNGAKSRQKIVAVRIAHRAPPEEKMNFVRSVLLGNVIRKKASPPHPHEQEERPKD